MDDFDLIFKAVILLYGIRSIFDCCKINKTHTILPESMLFNSNISVSMQEQYAKKIVPFYLFFAITACLYGIFGLVFLFTSIPILKTISYFIFLLFIFSTVLLGVIVKKNS